MTYAETADIRTTRGWWRLLAALTAVALVSAMLVVGPGAGTAHADVVGYQMIDPATGEPVGDPVFGEFPIDITLIVVGGNVVLNEQEDLEDGESTTGACVDFGEEELCDEYVEDPDADPITMSGQILDAEGTLVIPPEGVNFPDADAEFLDDIGVWMEATIEFPEGASGLIDPETGAMQLAGLLTFALTFFEDDGGEPGGEVAKCTVGADVDAVHDDPGKPTVDPTVLVDDWPAGQAYDEETGMSRPAHSDFVVDGPLERPEGADGTEPGTCDEGFFGGVVKGSVEEALGIEDGPNDDNYIGMLNQSVPVLLSEIPTDPIITDVDPLAGRDGETVSVEGAFFTPDTTATAELCDSDLANCEAMDNSTLTTDVEGNLSGTVDVPAGATTGDRMLQVTDTEGVSAASSFKVLGEATITLDPESGGAGTNVNVSGSDFDPNEEHTFRVHSPGDEASGSDEATATSSAVGDVGATVTIREDLIDDFAVDSQLEITVSGGTQSATATFTAAGDECTAVSQGDDDFPEGECSLEQTVLMDVEGGDLTMQFLLTEGNDGTTIINMSTVELDGTDQESTGAINTVRVSDFRGSLTGWTVTGDVTDLTTDGAGNVANVTIDRNTIEWHDLTCEAQLDAAQDEVAAGDDGPIVDATLCSAAPGGGGGVYDADADITIPVSASQAAGTYTGVLTFTLVGH